MRQELFKGEQYAHQAFDRQGLDHLLLMQDMEAQRPGIQLLAKALEPFFDPFPRPTRGIR